MKAKRKKGNGWKNNGWYNPPACWEKNSSKHQHLPSISLPLVMIQPDRAPQYPRIYCNLEDPKYDLFAQYWIRVAKTPGLTAKMTLVAAAP